METIKAIISGENAPDIINIELCDGCEYELLKEDDYILETFDSAYITKYETIEGYKDEYNRTEIIYAEKTPEEIAEEEKQEEIKTLKGYLKETDYIWNVIKEGDATEEDYADVIANRHTWRLRIRELEGE